MTFVPLTELDAQGNRKGFIPLAEIDAERKGFIPLDELDGVDPNDTILNSIKVGIKQGVDYPFSGFLRTAGTLSGLQTQDIRFRDKQFFADQLPESSPEEIEQARQNVAENPLFPASFVDGAGERNLFDPFVKSAEEFEKASTKVTGAKEVKRKEFEWSDLASLKRVTQLVAEGAPTMASLMVATMVNPQLSTSLMLAGEAGGTSKEIDDHEKETGLTIDPHKKALIALSSGAVKAALERAGMDAILGKSGVKALTTKFSKTMFGIGIEDLTEGIQGGVDYVAQTLYDVMEEFNVGELFSKVGKSMGEALPLSVTAGAGGSIFRKDGDTKTAKKEDDDVKKVRDEIAQREAEAVTPEEVAEEGKIADADQPRATSEQAGKLREIFEESDIDQSKVGEIATEILDESEIVRSEDGKFETITGKGAQQLIDNSSEIKRIASVSDFIVSEIERGKKIEKERTAQVIEKELNELIETKKIETERKNKLLEEDKQLVEAKDLSEIAEEVEKENYDEAIRLANVIKEQDEALGMEDVIDELKVFADKKITQIAEEKKVAKEKKVADEKAEKLRVETEATALAEKVPTMTFRDLQKELKSRGLKATGNKQVLTDRLAEDLGVPIPEAVEPDVQNEQALAQTQEIVAGVTIITPKQQETGKATITPVDKKVAKEAIKSATPTQITETQETAAQDVAKESGMSDEDMKGQIKDDTEAKPFLTNDDGLVEMNMGIPLPKQTRGLIGRWNNYLFRQGKGMEQGNVQQESENRKQVAQQINFDLNNDRKDGVKLQNDTVIPIAQKFLADKGYAKPDTQRMRIASDRSKSRKKRITALQREGVSRDLAEARLDNLDSFLINDFDFNVSRFIEDNIIGERIFEKKLTLRDVAEQMQEAGIDANIRGDDAVETLSTKDRIRQLRKEFTELNKQKKKTESQKEKDAIESKKDGNRKLQEELRTNITSIELSTLEGRIDQMIDGGIVASKEEKVALAKILDVTPEEIYPNLDANWIADKIGVKPDDPFVQWLVKWKAIRDGFADVLARHPDLSDEVRNIIYENAAYVKRNFAIDLLGKQMQIDPGRKDVVVAQVEGSVRESIARWADHMKRIPKESKQSIYSYITTGDQRSFNAVPRNLQERAKALRNTYNSMHRQITDLQFDPNIDEFTYSQSAQAIHLSALDMVDNYIINRTEKTKGQTVHGVPVDSILKRFLESREFRAMYGEVIDPVDRLMSTSLAQQQLFNNLNFLQQIGLQSNEGVVWSGAKDTKAGHVKMIPEIPKRYGNLSGKYVSQGTYDVVVGDFIQTQWIQTVSDLHRGLLARVRLGKLADLTPMMRNFGTSYVMSLANGDITTHPVKFTKHHNKGVKTLAKSWKGDKTAQAEISKMIGLGVLAKNAQSQVQETQIEIGADYLNSVSLTVNPEIASTSKLGKLKDAEKKVLQKAGEMYQLMDIPTKIASFQLHKELNLEAGMETKQAEESAAEFVKQHYQYTDRTSRIAKKMSKAGLADFMSFKFDAARIWYNGLVHAQKQFKKGDIRPMIGFTLANGVLGIAAATTAELGSEILGKALSKISLDDKDRKEYDRAVNQDEMNAIRHFQPEYWQDAVESGWYRNDGTPVLAIYDYVNFFPHLSIPAAAIQQGNMKAAQGKIIEEMVGQIPGMTATAAVKLFFGSEIDALDIIEQTSDELKGERVAKFKKETTVIERSGRALKDIAPALPVKLATLFDQLWREKTGRQDGWVKSSNEALQRIVVPFKIRAQDPEKSVGDKVRNNATVFSGSRTLASGTGRKIDDIDEQIGKLTDKKKIANNERDRSKLYDQLHQNHLLMGSKVREAMTTANKGKIAFPKYDSQMDFIDKFGKRLGASIHDDNINDSFQLAFKSQIKYIEDMGFDYDDYIETLIEETK